MYMHIYDFTLYVFNTLKLGNACIYVCMYMYMYVCICIFIYVYAYVVNIYDFVLYVF